MMQSILLMISSELNNEELLSDLNISTNNKLQCLFFEGNKLICLQGVFSPIFFFSEMMEEDPSPSWAQEAQLMGHHGNGRSLVLPPRPSSLMVAFIFLSTSTFSDRVSRGWKERKMSDMLCKWLNKEVQLSQAIGKYVHGSVEKSGRLMLTRLF